MKVALSTMRVAALAGFSALALSVSGTLRAEAELPISHVQHEGLIAGKVMTYEVSAGRLPIRDLESGEVHGRMGYTAFTSAPEKGRPRPVVFVWGGGPSGPSLDMQLHYGPAKVEDGRIVDNGNSLLSVADLVFVDPIGTGFSRAEQPDYLPEFYSTRGDAASLAEFVRVWIALNGREEAPLFLSGQSFGVWRSAIVAELLEQKGRRVSGVILTSGGTGLAADFISRADDIAMRVPDYAATALYHGRLDADLGTDLASAQAIGTEWAASRYSPALANIDALSDAEREAIATELARHTGYPLDKIDRKTLTFTPREYLKNFLGVEGQSLSTFDMRMVMDGSNSSNPVVEGREARAQSRYLREFTGYRTDLAYIGVEQGYTPVTQPDYREIGSRWNWDSSLPGTEAEEMASAAAGEGPPGKQPWLKRAIGINPDLRVFVEAGIYDSLNYCAANERRHQGMPADLADNYEMHCYAAGHGTFRDATANPLVMADMRRFIEETAR